VTFLRSTVLAGTILLGWSAGWFRAGQEPARPPARLAAAPPAQPEPKPQNDETPAKPHLPFEIALLETHIRFAANGDWRKEVHTIVKIVNVLGAQQFARISFDYNRSFEMVEIPLVRVRHANGGTSELLPSAVGDAPNPAVEQFAAYHDVRVKSVRILGLQEGDTLEYRVVTTTTKHPLAPDFWLEHSFDRSGQVLKEEYQLDLPSARKVEPRVNADAPFVWKGTEGSGEDAVTIYKWHRTYRPPEEGAERVPRVPTTPDVSVSTCTWERLSGKLRGSLWPGSKALERLPSEEEARKERGRMPEVTATVEEKALTLTREAKSDLERMKAIYGFLSSQINTVDVPLGSTGFRSRAAEDILNSGYATGEDKYVLFAALARAAGLRADAVLTGFCDKKAPANPSSFKHLVIIGATKEQQYWMDPAVEVAPFGMISPSEAACGLLLRPNASAPNAGQEWVTLPTTLPFAAFQRVHVDATISDAGQLSADVQYVVRGENELLLRVAFHQAPKDKWKDIATLLAISDGFRGQVTEVKASDPLSTEDAFNVEYQLTQLKFVDWSKKPVRIPALLPQIALPDLPPEADGGKPATIELGNPLDVETAMTLRLPEGTAVETPAGTSVARDYATYASTYSSAKNTVTATRKIDFLRRAISADRAVDYQAFLRATQNDEAQRLVLIPRASQKADPQAPSAAAKP
jgi:hypothetical protein